MSYQSYQNTSFFKKWRGVFWWIFFKSRKTGINRNKNSYFFIGGFSDFIENCFAGRKPGPFCRQNQISDETIDRIETAISRGYINSNKFVTIVYGVPKFKISKVFERIEKSISSSLYIASESQEISKDLTMSTSWEQFKMLLSARNEKMRSSDENCGCSEINECENEDTCPADSTCSNTVGSYTCDCNSGFVGRINSTGNLTCGDKNECENGESKCDQNAACENKTPGYDCICNEGFNGDGFSAGNGCTDDDECSVGTHNCHEKANCINTDGSFLCSCKYGYHGDAFADGNGCKDIDECALSNKVDEFNICHENADCLNTEASYQCDCNEGFVGDGKNSCQDIDECVLGLHTCHPMAQCENNEGGYECSCMAEQKWRGNGRVCSQVNKFK